MQIGVFGPVPYYGPRVVRGFPQAPRHYDARHGVPSMESGLRFFELADDLGFDCVSVSEHHFAAAQLTPEPTVFAAAMTQRVRNAKISVLGVLLPMVDPVRVAEQFAMLDTLCNGRLYPGVFRGTPNELMVYHSNPSESRARYEEAVQLVLKCWTEPEPFGWEGIHYRYRSIAIWPRPVQQPRPPLLITANSPQAARFAGKHRLDVGLSLGDTATKAMHIAHYKAAARQAGWAPTSENLLMRFIVHVAATDQQAREEFSRHMVTEPLAPHRGAHFRALWAAGIGMPVPREPARSAPPARSGLAAGPGMFPSLVGSPDTVLRQLHEVVESLGLGRVEMIFTGQSLPEALSVASLQLFAREVLPTLQRLDAQPFLDRIELAADRNEAAPAAAAQPG
jgi:alkanesulfonate monooxygenase SsuD/methylene tetrahydromethanopterin reductase-like flavin-dependent oxidoreductase (luciferase family)